jgi:hypothetical protein
MIPLELRSGRSIGTPLKSKMLVPIILNAVAGNPGIPSRYLRELFSKYVRSYALTDSILQEAKDLAKKQIFGQAKHNVQYAKGVVAELELLGHHVRVLYADRKEIVKAVCAVALQEELDRLKKVKQTMGRDEQVKYVKQWRSENDAFLSTELGLSDCTHQKTFVKGVLFATSTSSHTVPLLQDVIQADGANSQYGKYTLYLAYGSNANGHMSPVALGLLFGNEDKANWATFWNFVKELHPSLDNVRKTFLTDQDKGCLASQKDVLEHAAQFMCSFHRRQNILKHCGGGKGKIPYSALWVYNMLISCHDLHTLERRKTKYYKHMHPTDKYYLQRLPDESQYPAARCAMDDGVCMYGKSASSGVESMNNANQLA